MNQNVHTALSIISLLALFVVAILVFSQLATIGQRLDTLEKTAPAGLAGQGLTFGGLPADWTNAESPAQSLPLEEKDVPKDALKLEVTAAGFSPNQFTVKAGEEVILAVKSADQWVHTFVFDDAVTDAHPELSQVGIGLASQETRAITFFAPKEKGEYKFFCNVPGHRERGEEGMMIVE